MDFIKLHYIDSDKQKIGWLINVSHIIEVFEFPDGSCGVKTTNTGDEYTPVEESYEEVIKILKRTGRCWEK